MLERLNMETEHHRTRERGSGHETRDANVRIVVRFGIVLGALIVLSMVATKLFYDVLSHYITAGSPPAPFETSKQAPPPGAALLEPDPIQDYEKYMQDQEKALKSYGWADQKTGVVRIPVDQALQLVLKRGLPVRTSAENAGSATKPGEVQQYSVPQGYLPQQ